MWLRFSYVAWTTLAIVLFSIAGLRLRQQQHAATPEAMTHLVSRNLQHQQQALDILLKQEALIRKMFSDRLSASEVEAIAREPFYIYAFEDKDVLLFWNSNIVVSNCDTLSDDVDKSLYEKNGFYLKQCIRLSFLKPNQYLVALFPIVKKYPFTNQYIKSAFTAAEYIPVSTKVLAGPAPGSYAVQDDHKETLCYLQYNRENLPSLPPDTLIICCLLGGLLCLFVQVQQIAIRISNKRPFRGILLVLFVCGIFLACLNPGIAFFHFDNNHFFSPSYYASSTFGSPMGSSLGHLLLHLLCYFWIILFTAWETARLPIKRVSPGDRNVGYRLLLLVGATGLMMLGCVGIIRIAASIILDSQFNLDIANFYSIDIYAVISVVMLALLPLMAFGFTYTLNTLLKPLRMKGAKYGCILAGAVLSVVIDPHLHTPEIGWLFAWLLLTLLLLDRNLLSGNGLTNFEKVLTCSVYLTICFSPLVQHYLNIKEERDRETFAQRTATEIGIKPLPATAGNGTSHESLYPELLLDEKKGEIPAAKGYTYAIYRNKALVRQTSDHPFPLYLRNDTLATGEKSLFRRDDYSVLRYKADAQTTVSIIDRSSSIIVPLTTVSIVLIAMLLICAGIALVHYGLLLRNGSAPAIRVQVSFRMRIYMAILGLVLLSFTVIGIATWHIFNNRNTVSNKQRLRITTYTIGRLLQQYLSQHHVETNYSSFNSLTDSVDFKDYIVNLSQNRSVDVNVYDSLGTLLTSSQDDIYKSDLLATIMNPDAYHTLTEEEKAVVVQEEHISKLKYLSCYVPLRNEDGKAYGYLNVPYLASGRELSFQISNVLVALIDVYVFMLIVSIGAAFFISNRLTKGLRIITEHFEHYSATDNVAINWKHSDEIGLMIEKYNANLAKVQEAVEKLAKSERESAWREMARQVAHEIKNPLTPMKLNIQYLQMALQKGGDNISQLTEKTASSLLEQIDNLSHIASAFSDFARMPEAVPEPVTLNDLLQKVVALHRNNPAITVSLQMPEAPVTIFTDRSQMLRVMNNLLQNAIDAIPDASEGVIRVILEQQDDEALVSVADNGSGIPEEAIPKIFNPYFTTKGSGTGLGLAMTRKIIEFWKGSIRFETAVDKGTTFYIRLPLLHG